MVSGFTAVTRCDAFVRRSPIVARCHRYVTWLGQASRAPGLLQLGPQLGLAADRPAGEDLLDGRRPLRPAPGDERDRPVEERGDPVLEADQVEDVHPQPHQPGGEPGEPEALDVGDRVEARYGREVALVEVVERLPGLVAFESADDLPRGVLAALHS